VVKFRFWLSLEGCHLSEVVAIDLSPFSPGAARDKAVREQYEQWAWNLLDSRYTELAPGDPSEVGES
jgi:hypothetical protein